MRTKRFDFNFKPLQLQISFSADGSVPDRQNYSTDTHEYTPDYTIVPLEIQPRVSVLDKDEVLPAGEVNHALTNIRWYEIINSVKKLISAENAQYDITTSGPEAGRIKVKRNAEPKVPITLEFYAEYIDARNKQVNIIRSTYSISCSSSADQVRVELDASDQTIFNPLAEQEIQTVTAKVWRGDKVCPAELYTLVWEVMAEDGTWHAPGADTVLDYDVTAEGSTATINRQLMGSEMHLRCRCRYNDEPLTEASPSAEISFIRRIPRYEYDYTGVPVNIPSGLLEISPTAIISGTNGEIENAEMELLPLWYIATNKAGGSLSYSLVAHGKSPVIPTDKMDETYGGVIGLDVIDRGPWQAATDSDGAVLTDSDGAVLIIH